MDEENNAIETLDEIDALQTYGVSEEDQIIEIDHNRDRDENMLPVHFLPEGKKCYDWINQDVNNENNENKSKAKTKYVNSITYTSANMAGGGTNMTGSYVNQNAIVHDLLNSAENGDLETLKEILEKHPLCVNLTDSDGYTATHRACYSGHEHILLHLIQHGGNISAKTNDGWQPIHCAARWNKVNICKILLDQSVDVNAVTNGSQTALHFASLSTENVQLLELLILQPNININIKNGAGDTAYDLAYRSGPQYKLFDMVDESLKI